MVSLQIFDEFTNKITDFIDLVEKGIELFEKNENPLGNLHTELIELSQIKKKLLNLLLKLCFSTQTVKFIEHAYKERVSNYRQKRDNLIRKYQFEDILFVSERNTLEKMATSYKNILDELDKESISELKELEKKLAYESLFHTRTNYVLMEEYDRKMRFLMMNQLPKCDSVSKKNILGDLERLDVEDTIVSFLSYSRKISSITVQNLKTQIKDFHVKRTSLKSDSTNNEKSCLDNKKKRKKNKKKKKRNQELFIIVKIQATFRKYRHRKLYQKTLMYIKLVQSNSRRLIYQQRYHLIRKSVQLIQRKLSFWLIYRHFCSIKEQIVSQIQNTQTDLESLRKSKYNLDSFKSQFIELGQLKYQLLMVCFTGLINSSNTHSWIQECNFRIQKRHQGKRKFISKHQILMIDPTLKELIISKSIQECTTRVNYLRKSNSKCKKKINLEIDIQNNKLVYLKKKYKLFLKYHHLKKIINKRWGNTQEEQLSDVNKILRTLDCLELEDLGVSFDSYLQYVSLLKYTSQEKRIYQLDIQSSVSLDKSLNNQSGHGSQQRQLNKTKNRLESLEREVGDFFEKRYIEISKIACSQNLDTYPSGKKAPFIIIGNNVDFSSQEQEFTHQKGYQFLITEVN